MDLIDGQRSLADIVEQLCAEFDVSKSECADETVKFAKLLIDKKVLELL